MENNLLPRRERVYFASGDLVELKKNLPNKPVMLVQAVDKLTMSKDEKPVLLGVTCIWFTTEGALQKGRFSTKDLNKIAEDDKVHDSKG
jgi:hypothetical protein